ncbi:MAG: hypothetical protein R3F37_07995 [Candidatus Competibacteraceae bacterium]
MKQQRADFLLAQAIRGRGDGMSPASQLAIVEQGLSLAPDHGGLLALQAELQEPPPTAPETPVNGGQEILQTRTESVSAGVLTAALEQQLPPESNTAQDAANYRLTVVTQPKNARVRILNIKPRYHDGISLSPGSYHIEVDHPDYRPKRQWITIADQDVSVAIQLSPARQLPFPVSNPPANPRARRSRNHVATKKAASKDFSNDWIKRYRI